MASKNKILEEQDLFLELLSTSSKITDRFCPWSSADKSLHDQSFLNVICLLLWSHGGFKNCTDTTV